MQGTEILNPKVRSVRFYSCGGTGINLLRRYRENQPLERRDIYAAEQYSYIDTSTANLRNVSLENVFILEGVDGSGSERRRNAEAIQKAVPSILIAHPPADMNIVIFSASGGTGSVAGPLLLEAILAEGKAAICLVIGTHESSRHTDNVISTLQGMELAVKRLNRPIVMHYTENDPSKTFGENDIRPQFVMGALSVLCSGRNGHIDSADVMNLFDFHRVTHRVPSLAILDIFAREEDLQERNQALGYLSLLKSEEEVSPRIASEYSKTGYLPTSPDPRNSFYYLVCTDRLNKVFSALQDRKKQSALQKRVTNTTTSLIDDTASVDSTGLVF